jgi:hypothetical protein
MCGIDSGRLDSAHDNNPEGIESFSPALAMQSPTLGDEPTIASTLKGLNAVAMVVGADDATPLGLGIIWGDDYPG